MIRLLFLLFSLSSCTSRDYLELPATIYESIKGADIEITDSLIESREFSFIKVRLGRSIVATMTLSKIDQNIYEWVGQDLSERIYTKDGKIIKTLGLKYDMEIIDHYNFSLQSVTNKGKYIIRFKNPSGIFTNNYNIKKYSISEYKGSILSRINNSLKGDGFYIEPKHIIEERFRTEVFRWSGKNYYWLDINNNLIRTVQTVHPKLPKITIDYFYKY